jgi:hypothetical protein
MTEACPSYLIRAAIRAEYLSLRLLLNRKKQLTTACQKCVKDQKHKVHEKIVQIRANILQLNLILIDRNESPEEEI